MILLIFTPIINTISMVFRNLEIIMLIFLILHEVGLPAISQFMYEIEGHRNSSGFYSILETLVCYVL